jgi:hypothetical protein
MDYNILDGLSIHEAEKKLKELKEHNINEKQIKLIVYHYIVSLFKEL